jgi:hypothetical protein
MPIQPKPLSEAKPPSDITPLSEAKVAFFVEPAPPKPVLPPPAPAPIIEPHEILKTHISLKADIIANPQDYETEPYPFDLKCPNGHFRPAGTYLPVSKGKAFCLQCGERLKKPKRKKRQSYGYGGYDGYY